MTTRPFRLMTTTRQETPPMTTLTYDDLDVWQALGEWLERQPGQTAVPSDVPAVLAHLIVIGSDPDSRAARTARYRYGLITYTASGRWHLHQDWRDRLARFRHAPEGTP